MNIRNILMLCAATLVAASGLFAQNVVTMRGPVTDPSGAAIPAAVITLTGPNGAVRTAETNQQGVYSANGLAPTYHFSLSSLFQ